MNSFHNRFVLTSFLIYQYSYRRILLQALSVIAAKLEVVKVSMHIKIDRRLGKFEPAAHFCTKAEGGGPSGAS